MVDGLDPERAVRQGEAHTRLKETIDKALRRFGSSVDALSEEAMQDIKSRVIYAPFAEGRPLVDTHDRFDRDVLAALRDVAHEGLDMADEEHRIFRTALAAQLAQADADAEASVAPERNTLPAGATEAERVTHLANAAIDAGFNDTEA
jgi:hypothetical protein